MMYSEFAEAVGCKDNEHNHEVFRNLEIMYMNSDMTKEEIYAYGRRLVDNSKSPAEIEAEAKILEEIEELKDENKWYKEKIDLYTHFVNDTLCSWEEEREYKNWIKMYREYIRRNKVQIKELKWILGR